MINCYHYETCHLLFLCAKFVGKFDISVWYRFFYLTVFMSFTNFTRCRRLFAFCKVGLAKPPRRFAFFQYFNLKIFIKGILCAQTFWANTIF